MGLFRDRQRFFDETNGIAFAYTGHVFVSDRNNHRVQYFTNGGSFVGKFGSKGSGNGQFFEPMGLAFSRTGARLYVCDAGRIQYFNRYAPAVAPASLGRVKALFN